MRNSDFRLYVYEKWFEYKEEVLAWEKKNVEGSPEAYFHKYKWFLKAKYKVDNKGQ
jgi:hypothetical protein